MASSLSESLISSASRTCTSEKPSCDTCDERTNERDQKKKEKKKRTKKRTKTKTIDEEEEEWYRLVGGKELLGLVHVVVKEREGVLHLRRRREALVDEQLQEGHHPADSTRVSVCVRWCVCGDACVR